MSSQPRKHCQCVNLNHADAKVIGSSLIGIGPKVAQDIVKLWDHISTEQGCYLEAADLTLNEQVQGQLVDITSILDNKIDS